MRQSRRHIICLLAAAFLMSLLPACTNDAPLSPSEPEYTDGPDVWLTLKLSPTSALTSTRSTRTDENGHPDESGIDFENYISNDNFTIFFLNESLKVFKTLYPSDPELISFTYGTSNQNFKLRINQEFLKVFTTEGKNFYILMVANQNGPSAESERFSGGYFLKSLDEIVSSLVSFAVEDGSSWIPSQAQGIPMCGILKMEVPNWDSHTEMANEFNAGTITLQRSMSKIRVIDNIDFENIITDANGKIHRRFDIKSVNVKNICSKGCYIPTGTAQEAWFNNEWLSAKIECTSARDKHSEWYKSGMTLVASPTNLIKNNQVELRHELYLPEMDWSNTEDMHPILEIVTVKHKINDNGEVADEEKTFWNINLKNGKVTKMKVEKEDGTIKQYSTGDTSETESKWTDRYDCFVRNHIYEYNVGLKLSGGIDVDATVCEWSEMTADQIEFN